ncbi:hypothetical protein [Arcobacter sp.]|uniref:hypothetical protein n=1 Tax=Arcobacter sp. TaxID=1872629 RepID=UPI003D0AE2CE
MNQNDIKKEFAKVILKAKIIAAIFFILLAPSIVITIKGLDELFGYGKDIWFNISVLGFVIYGIYYLFFWKCPKCGAFPGRGWFRKNCDNCATELN